MLLAWVRVLSIVTVALYLVPTGAHLFELAGKLAMSPAEYMATQRIYDGWALFGIVLFVAILLALIHAILRRHERRVFALSLVAFVCLVGTLGVFSVFTYPMNVASNNWTTMPEPFEMARRQWEYSHAASALLTFLALVALTTAVATDARQRTWLDASAGQCTIAAPGRSSRCPNNWCSTSAASTSQPSR